MEEKIEKLKTAAADFNAGLELVAEAFGTLSSVINDLPKEDDLRQPYLDAIGYDTIIAISVYRMLKVAKDFPAKFAAAQILLKMSGQFHSLLFMNFMANVGAWSCCPVHGPQCGDKAHNEEFPQYVDQNLQPIAAETEV